MKKFIAISLLTLIFSTCAWTQIPNPAYITSEYQDTTVTEDNVGQANSINNMPQYYVLAYIMRIN